MFTMPAQTSDVPIGLKGTVSGMAIRLRLEGLCGLFLKYKGGVEVWDPNTTKIP